MSALSPLPPRTLLNVNELKSIIVQSFLKYPARVTLKIRVAPTPLAHCSDNNNFSVFIYYKQWLTRELTFQEGANFFQIFSDWGGGEPPYPHPLSTPLITNEKIVNLKEKAIICQ